MAVINRIAGFADDMTAWRRHLHQNPELAFDLFDTAQFVADRLREFGVDEIHEGIAKTGIVAVIEGKGEGPVTALRADMDALPINEATGAEWASRRAGAMHACGHDGHTTMLLGAARYLAETRNFAGRAVLVFQPAEENGGGGGVMVDEGIMDRFGIDAIYALHTLPGLEAGNFQTTPGPIMAAVDSFHINIKGLGGHGAMPHDARDPVMAAVGIAQALQTITSRNHYALDDLVISVTQIHTGSADNIVPDTAYVGGTVRSFSSGVQDMVRTRMAEIVAGQAASYGVSAELDYDMLYPATINHAAQTAFAAGVAAEVSGAAHVNAEMTREMGAEDFSYMLQARPGAYLFLGQGEAAGGLHHPAFDFNDAVAPVGASFFARIIEQSAPAA
ncbi:MAG: amidohydrolase [Sediminimonas qiaohouensis]|uniref:Amidohydrolase n=1 Tax=Sediminimonas qiaohouensis TaxID=552061 RepID=A0A7C9HKY6_9RHOB|nr:M20 aminoacylase family protein [Sediminimonas qiaohouensis]MTJ04148.1 amidohydrolase [Sediminimonas qiaohouensis]